MCMHSQTRESMKSDDNRLVGLQHKFVGDNFEERLFYLKYLVRGSLKENTEGKYRPCTIQVHKE